MPSETRFSPFTRLFFLFGVIPLLFIAGIQLFILSSQTETYFAWTIALPLTAAFMGAGYWAALAHAFMIVRNPDWDEMRVSLPAAFTATTLLLVATLLHLDTFHLDSPTFVTRFVTWVWIVVYVVTPPIFLYFLVRGFRGTERKQEGGKSFSGWGRMVFYLLAVFSLIFGLGLFFLPGFFSSFWPWNLPTLASRAVGAWLTTFGVAAAALGLQNDRVSGRGALASLLAFCALQLIVLLRYPGSVDFSNPLAWGYLLFLLLGMAVSGAGLLK